MFYITGISLSFFLCILLFTKKNKTTADNILAAWLFVIAVHLLLFFLTITGSIYDYPFLIGLHIPIPLMHGPFLYVYALTLTSNTPVINNKRILHFIPALLSYSYMLQFIFSPAEQKIYIFKNKGIGYETFLKINFSAILISGIVYVILTTILLRRHRKRILDQFSYTENINLNWIRNLIFGIALIWIFVIIGNDELIFTTAVLFVIFIGYFGIKQVGIFTHNLNSPNGNRENNSPKGQGSPDNYQNEPDKSTVINEKISEADQDLQSLISEKSIDGISGSPRKYSKSGLSEEMAIQLHQQLKEVVHSGKLFNQSELTLTELAKRLGTHPNYLSQVINEKEGKNFYDYINTLRIEEFKKMVADPGNKKFTLLGLALECGFNSKSSFNKYFRKMTGQSPTEYLQVLEMQES